MHVYMHPEVHVRSNVLASILVKEELLCQNRLENQKKISTRVLSEEMQLNLCVIRLNDNVYVPIYKTSFHLTDIRRFR